MILGIRMGLRETAKIDKLKRIRAAAEYVFRKKGYESATTREIAARAKVSVGTLFVYAPAKRDLLLMVYNDNLEKLPISEPQSDAPLIEQLVTFYRARFEFWGRHPQLSRFVVREVFDPVDRDPAAAAQTVRFRNRRQSVVSEVQRIVERRQAVGEIDSTCDAALVAQLMHNIFLSENRQWLESPEPEINFGVERLRALLTLAIGGCFRRVHNESGARER